MGRGRNRRRIDRAGQGGASPRARTRSAGLALVALGLLGVLALGARQAAASLAAGDWLRIREIRFSGLRAASEAELLELSPVKRGDSLLLADVEAAERALARHPWVASAEVRRRLPPALEVTVRERKAAALVDLQGLYLVDGAGQPFKRAAAGDGLDLPLITGIPRQAYLSGRAEVERLLAGAVRLQADWAAAGLQAELPIAEIHLGDDGVTVYAGEEGTQVRLGEGELEKKLDRLRAVLRALRAEGKRAEAIHLDSRTHPSRVTVRPRVAAVDGR